MDSAMNAGAAVAGLLSLTIQIAQVTQQHIANVHNLPRVVSCYIEELVCLKKVLLDVQDALLLGSASVHSLGIQLPLNIAEFDVEMNQLCAKLRNAQQTAASQVLKRLFWPLRDDETARWTESLARCRHRVQASVVTSGLKIQLTTLEEIRMIRYRQEVQEKEILRLEILDWISDDSAKKKHSELLSSHHPGTGQWIFQKAQFKQWIGGDKTVLWCYGNPGVGKTQITSLIAQQLSRDYHVAYFYCSHQESNSQTQTAIAASLLRQLLDAGNTAIPPSLEELHKRLGHGVGRPRFDDIAHILLELCTIKRPVCILVDALDECNPATKRKQILSLLYKLSEAGAKVMITGRPHISNATRLLGNLVKLEIESAVSDVRAYTEYMVEQSDELSDLISENLREEVVQRVVEQTNKMFLLAVFQCLHLRRLARRSEVRKALRSLPSGLEMAYEESMLRITHESAERRSVALSALSWIYHAKRPLTVPELLQALSIDPAARHLSEEDTLSRNLVMDTCAGLVVLDLQSDVARFAHYSVYEYFHQESTYRRWFPSAKKDIAMANFAFLRLEDLACDENTPEEKVGSLLSSYPFLSYAAHCWGHHARDEYHSDMDDLALEFLENQSRIELVARILDGGGELGRRRRQGAQMYPSENLAVQLTARFGASELLELLVSRGHSLVHRDASRRTALHWAARGGFHPVVNLILQKGAEADASTADGRTPLHWAAKHGHVEVVAELIRHGADPTRPAADGRTALHWAASRGHRSVVDVLLADGRVDAACRSQNGWTALHWAACSGNRTVVMYGVEKEQGGQRGPETDAGLSPSPSPKEQLSMSGGEAKAHEGTVTLLLKAGVAPDSCTEDGRTALHWAAASGNLNVIRLLRDHGAGLTSSDINGKLPWHFAVENGAEAAVIDALSIATEVPIAT